MQKIMYALMVVFLCGLSFFTGRYTATVAVKDNQQDSINESKIELEVNYSDDNKQTSQSLPPIKPHTETVVLQSDNVVAKDAYDDLVFTNEQLRAEKEALEELNRKLDLDYKLLTATYSMAKARLESNNIGYEPVPLEKMKEATDSPIAALVANSPMSRDVYDHATQETDFEWATLMEQRISDFFITHDSSYGFRLEKVTCKTTSCDIFGYELEKEAVDVMAKDLKKQNWWNFKFSTGYRTDPSADGGAIFYLLAKK